MTTQAEYSRLSGLSRGRISQLVKAGMPLDSADAANGWRLTQKRWPGKPPPAAPAKCSTENAVNLKLAEILAICRRFDAKIDAKTP